MELMPWRSRPMSPVSSLQAEMNRMFEDFFQQPFGVPLMRTRMQPAVVPALDVKEDENSIVITAEVPGINREDIEITVQDNVLEIRGQKSEQQKSEQENYHMVERSYGTFSRRITLPSEVDSEQAEASLNNGVLTLVLPKSEQAGKKVITIQGSAQQQAMGQSPTQQAQQGMSQGQQPGSSQPGASQGSSQVSGSPSSRQSGQSGRSEQQQQVSP